MNGRAVFMQASIIALAVLFVASCGGRHGVAPADLQSQTFTTGNNSSDGGIPGYTARSNPSPPDYQPSPDPQPDQPPPDYQPPPDPSNTPPPEYEPPPGGSENPLEWDRSQGASAYGFTLFPLMPSEVRDNRQDLGPYLPRVPNFHLLVDFGMESTSVIVRVENASDWTDAPFLLLFDPARYDPSSVSDGGFLRGAGADMTMAAVPKDRPGCVDVDVVHIYSWEEPNISGGGWLCTIVFKNELLTPPTGNVRFLPGGTDF